MTTEAYTEVDYFDECEALEERPAPTPDSFAKFVAQCMDLGLTAKFHHETHWQILSAGKPLVDFWPTAKKLRPCQCKPKEKAKHGTAANAIALATTLAAGKVAKTVKQINDSRESRRERIATAVLAALVRKVSEAADAAMISKPLAEDACILADALIAELEKGNVTP